MEHRRINAFAEHELDHGVKLAIARDLQRNGARCCKSRYQQTFGG